MLIKFEYFKFLFGNKIEESNYYKEMICFYCNNAFVAQDQ